MRINLDTLVQFNKREFYRLFGNYVRSQRQALKLQTGELSEICGLPETELKNIEAGKKKLNQGHLLALYKPLQFNDDVLIQLTRITQIEHILNVTKELDEFFPR